MLKNRILNPFPMVELADFLPAAFEDTTGQANAATEDPYNGQASEPVIKRKKPLCMVRWAAAFQAYALAADATEVRYFACCYFCF